MTKFKVTVTIIVVLILSLSFTVSAEEGTYGGTLVYGRGNDSVSLDPINTTDGESFKVTQQIYDTLLMYKPGTTEPVSCLAKDWEVTEDGKKWTFYLRENINFHDGTSFNAEAVKFNFDRWRFEDNQYHVGGTFASYPYVFGGFPGIIKEVNVVSDYVVEFVLKNPQAPFLANMAMVSFAIASPEALKKWGEDYFKHPVGTGAFEFVEWRQGDRIILKANEEYWAGRPYLDRIIFRSIPDNGARYMELQSGTIDMMDGINPEDVKSIKENENFKVVLRPSLNVGYLAMNFEREPFDNRLVRQAVSHAINKEALIGAFYAGLAEPAKNPIPPAMWGYNDEIEDYKYNIDKAKDLLEEAGYPNGFEFDLWYMPVPRPYMPQPKLIAQAIQNYLSVINIEANLISYDWGTYLEKVNNKDEADTYLLGWYGDNGDPDNFLYVLLDQTNSNNNYKNEELHEILVEAQRTMNHGKRVELYKEAQVIIHSDIPWVPLAHSTPPIALKNNVNNFIPDPNKTEKFTEVWIENK